MNTKQAHIAISAVVCLIAALILMPSLAKALEDTAQKVKTSMALLQSEAEKLGSAKIEGTDRVAGLDVPALYFGGAKMNNNFDLVDGVAEKMGGTATVFVKQGENFVRVATNVKKDDGSRAVGTILDPNGKVIVKILNKPRSSAKPTRPPMCRSETQPTLSSESTTSDI
jgi:hypothetical protein